MSATALFFWRKVSEIINLGFTVNYLAKILNYPKDTDLIDLGCGRSFARR